METGIGPGSLEIS